jgi:hypothetical protein
MEQQRTVLILIQYSVYIIYICHTVSGNISFLFMSFRIREDSVQHFADALVATSSHGTEHMRCNVDNTLYTVKSTNV